MPDLKGVTIQTAKIMPCTNAQISLNLKGYSVTLKNLNKHQGRRQIFIDGNLIKTEYDNIMDTEKAYISNENLHNGIVIEVLD